MIPIFQRMQVWRLNIIFPDSKPGRFSYFRLWMEWKRNVVIVELKQWEKLASIDGQDAIVETYTGGANRRVVHPCYQAWSYAALIRDYNEYVQDNEIGLHPCAYLHNYPRSRK